MEKKSHWAKKGIEEEKKGNQTRPLCEALFSLTCIPLCENLTIQLALHFRECMTVKCVSNLKRELEEGQR